MPQIPDGQLRLAQAEVARRAGPPPRREVPEAEAREVIEGAIRRIRPAADDLCRELGVGVCAWTIRARPNRSLFAGAGPDGLILVDRGIVEYAANDEEVAFVIGHEIAHQAANHIATADHNATTGALVGGMLLGVPGFYAGRAIGRLSYSREQEREADFLSAVILFRSGIDLDRARGFLVTLARASGRLQTSMLDTHPAGPERIAGWDQAVAEIRASNGRLPRRTA